jgi:hypothetical protein
VQSLRQYARGLERIALKQRQQLSVDCVDRLRGF